MAEVKLSLEDYCVDKAVERGPRGQAGRTTASLKMNTGTRMRGSDGNSPFPPNSQMDRCFRRRGLPDSMDPDDRCTPRNRLVTGSSRALTRFASQCTLYSKA
jgi:hypothetical protein